jgi:uncharacterized protein (DUF2147 family)
MSGLKLLRAGVVVCWCASLVLAQAPARTTPVGRWKTLGDLNGKATSLVAIWEENGKLYGRIEKLLNPNARDNPRCTLCPGDLKDQPVVGWRFIWDLHKDGAPWSGGRILEPDSAKTYRCLIALEDGGKKPKVRGFIGASLLGRTPYWFPEE